MRSTNSIKNTIVSIITNIVTILIGLVAQAIFVRTLGSEYLGINGLFSNIISMLAIVELGIGSAIIFSLYKPIAEDDREKIKSLMKFYKISYRIIACLVTIIGLCVIPFLKYIVGATSIQENIIFIYILFLLDTTVSYLLTYKRSILYADQKTYITNIVHIGYLIIMNAIQIAILLLSKNYIAYLIIKIIFRLLENIVITIISNKMYPYITEKDAKELDKDTKHSIFTKIRGLIYHKIGSFLVLGTDNIVISIFFGVVTVGYYSNYSIIITAVSTLFGQIFSSLIASVGNLLVEENKEKSYSIFKNMLLVNSWLYCFATCGIICMIEPFIKIWVGGQYILEYNVLIVLMANFYIQGMRQTYNTFKMAAGIFYEDRFVPLFESTLNIVFSIILLKIFGLAGVFLGTIVSSFALFMYSYPKYIYKGIFKRSYLEYAFENINYIIITAVTVIITTLITKQIIIPNNILQIIVNGVFVIIIPNAIYYIIFRKTDEFKYLKSLIMNYKNRRNINV